MPDRIYLDGLDADSAYKITSTGEIYGGDELMYAGLTVPDITGDYGSVTCVLEKVALKK